MELISTHWTGLFIYWGLNGFWGVASITVAVLS